LAKVNAIDQIFTRINTLTHWRTVDPTSRSSRSRTACMVGATLLLTMAILLSVRSQFLWHWALTSEPVLYLFVALYVAAGGIYLAVIGSLRRIVVGRKGVLCILLVGLLMRLALLPSAPVLETDSFRYMWDAALTARGASPYLHTPEKGKSALTDLDGDSRIRAVAREAGSHLKQINHPDVKTIYPPVAQAAFLLAYWISPWNGAAWRAILLVADAATVLLLLVLMRHLRLPLAWIAIYWWNPLLVKEFYCAGHMDAIVLPFVTGAVMLAVMQRTALAAAALAAAVAAKFWPVVLLPLLLRSVVRQPRRVALSLAAFTVTAAILLSPMLVAGHSGIAGSVDYSRSWQSNDGLFQLVVLLCRHTLPLVGVHAWAEQMAARLTVTLVLVAWVLWLARRPLNDPLELCEASLLAVAGLFLLSPTQFPWYYTWMLPLLALRPRWSLLLYTALLPLYHLHYSRPAWVWVEHLPVWAFLSRIVRARSVSQLV